MAAKFKVGEFEISSKLHGKSRLDFFPTFQVDNCK